MRPVAQSEMKEISLDDDDDDIYEYIDEDRDDRRTGRHSLDAIRDAARVANIQPVTQLPPRRRVLVTEGNFFEVILIVVYFPAGIRLRTHDL